MLLQNDFVSSFRGGFFTSIFFSLLNSLYTVFALLLNNEFILLRSTTVFLFLKILHCTLRSCFNLACTSISLVLLLLPYIFFNLLFIWFCLGVSSLGSSLLSIKFTCESFLLIAFILFSILSIHPSVFFSLYMTFFSRNLPCLASSVIAVTYIYFPEINTFAFSFYSFVYYFVCG